MRYLSLFSGIGGFDLAFQRAGMNCVGMVEIDKNCQGVLHKQFDYTHVYDDVKEINGSTFERGTVELVCGGFPCQDLSIAGKRAGLAGERSGLWFGFARVIDELEPRWVVIENVPGLLSSDKGKDFAVIIQWLAERGYGVAWRVLDAQFFGIPQRRRRVFIVGSLRNGSCAEVLFEREGMSGNPAEGKETGEEIASPIGASPSTGRSPNIGNGQGNIVSYTIQQNDNGSHHRKDRPNGGLYVNETETALTVGGSDLTAVCIQQNQREEVRSMGDKSGALSTGQGMHNQNFIAYNMSQQDDDRNGGLGGLSIEKTDKSITIGSKSETWVMSSGQANAEIVKDGESSLTGLHEQPIVATSWTLRQGKEGGGKGYLGLENKAMTLGGQEQYLWEMQHASEAYRPSQGGVAPTLQQRMGTGGNNIPLVGVRRLTPTECERLQGFPDDWTKYAMAMAKNGMFYEEKEVEQKDSVRYRQLGNAVAVPVVEWIGKRIMEAENERS